MATIKSQMVLNDGMSRVLTKIVNGLNTTLGAFEQVQQISGNAIDVANIEAARVALAEASSAVDEMAENYRLAAQEEEKLNQGIREGTSAAGRLLGKITSMVAAYAGISSIKGLITDSLEAADVQIGAQVQLRTVLNNMGTEERFAGPANETSVNTLENSLKLDVSGALDNYASAADDIGGHVLENTLTLNTAEAIGNYGAFAADIIGNSLEVGLEIQTDNSGALSAYDAILAKASEIQSRGMYGDETMIAGAAELATYFKDANAILSMMDTLANYAAGMSGGGELDSTAMVDYATGIGKIMTGSYDAMTKKGFEFSDAQKAIIEGTATEAQIVAELGTEYLGLSQDMQAAAVINAVIAESWGGLYEAMGNTPEGQIISFNNALGDIKETVGAGIYPAVLDLMNTFTEHLPQIESLAQGLAGVLGTILSVLSAIATAALNVATFIQDNWSVIGPIVETVAAAFLAYKVVTLAAAAAQWVLNGAMAASPVTWIVLAVVALVAGIVALCNWIAKTTGVAKTGLGVIAGGINVAIQAVKNAGLVVANVALAIWNSLGAVCSNIGTAFHNVIANVQGWFYGLLATAVRVVESICAALNKLPFVEFDYSGITAKADEYAAKSAEAYGSVQDYKSISDAFHEGLNTYDTFTEGWAAEAFQAGASWGDGIVDKVDDFFDGFAYKPGNLEELMEKYGGTNIPGSPLEGIGDDVGMIADNTGSMADSLSVSEEELKYLRDIAERDAINRFTTAEVKIDMTGMTNRIDSDMDLDGVIGKLTDGFSEALITAAEGVHT